ncbi:hypothetical protein K6U06_05580, partial [Acidiferrimicrobium sp. IK]|uniref:hypothetical protein n=1 Tax=Acidiferrimicrobium sp. IK TaxID=2871700 RepID=UPI0021CAEAE4
ILDDASRSHRKLDPAEGLQDAQLDTGARLHIVHSDIGRDGQVSERTHAGVGGSIEPPGRGMEACWMSG